MNWSIYLSLLSFVVFSTQIVFGVEQVETPWKSTQMTENFIASFLSAIARSNAFSSRQLNDLSPIQKTLADAMELFTVSNMNLKTKFQALNMVFASAVAEVVVSDSTSVNIETKIKEIENSLISAFQETTGSRNLQFVVEIKNLIFTLTHTKTIGVPNKSIVNVDDDKQGPSGQAEASTSAKAINAVGVSPQQGPKIVQQGSSAVSIANSQGISEIGSQRLSPPVPSIQAQNNNNKAAAVATAESTGSGLKSSLQFPSTYRSNEIGQEGLSDYYQTTQKSKNEAKYGTISQGLDGNGQAASGNYGENSITKGLQRPQAGEIKRPGISMPLKAVSQASGEYEMRAQSPSTMAQKESGSGAVNSLMERYSSYNEQDRMTHDSFIDVDQRYEMYEPDNYRLDGTSAISDGAASVKPANSAEGYSSDRSRANVAGSTGYDNLGIATKGVQEEKQNILESSTNGSQDEKETESQILLDQRSSNQRQYGILYEGSSQVEGQELNSPRILEARGRADGSNGYGRASTVAVATAAGDSNGVTGLPGKRSNGPALFRSNGYASGISTGMVEPIAGNNAVGSFLKASRVLQTEVNPEMFPPSSSIVSRNPMKTSDISNIVSHIRSKVDPTDPGFSYCNVHIQTMLEVIEDLVHLLGYCN